MRIGRWLVEKAAFAAAQSGKSTCFANGLEDLLAWKGADYADFLLPVVGGMAGFAYFRFKRAGPPCMVFWGANPKYLYRELAGIIGFKETLIEGRQLKSTFEKLKEFIDRGEPVVTRFLLRVAFD